MDKEGSVQLTLSLTGAEWPSFFLKALGEILDPKQTRPTPETTLPQNLEKYLQSHPAEHLLYWSLIYLDPYTCLVELLLEGRNIIPEQPINYNRPNNPEIIYGWYQPVFRLIDLHELLRIHYESLTQVFPIYLLDFYLQTDLIEQIGISLPDLILLPDKRVIVLSELIKERKADLVNYWWIRRLTPSIITQYLSIARLKELTQCKTDEKELVLKRGFPDFSIEPTFQPFPDNFLNYLENTQANADFQPEMVILKSWPEGIEICKYFHDLFSDRDRMIQTRTNQVEIISMVYRFRKTRSLPYLLINDALRFENFSRMIESQEGSPLSALQIEQLLSLPYSNLMLMAYLISGQSQVYRLHPNQLYRILIYGQWEELKSLGHLNIEEMNFVTTLARSKIDEPGESRFPGYFYNHTPEYYRLSQTCGNILSAFSSGSSSNLLTSDGSNAGLIGMFQSLFSGSSQELKSISDIADQTTTSLRQTVNLSGQSEDSDNSTGKRKSRFRRIT